MEYFRKAVAVAAVAVFVGGASLPPSEAGVKSFKHQTIKMKVGTRTGIQDVYAWNKNCRTVRARFTPLSSKNGRLYKVRARFRITKLADRKCAGKSVRGYRVVFKPHKKYKGATVVKYQIRPRNLPDTYVFSRRMIVR